MPAGHKYGQEKYANVALKAIANAIPRVNQ